MANETIFVGIDNERIELVGEDLTAFKAQRILDKAAQAAIQAEADAKVAARQSALTKLAALGLTADEIGAL